MRPAFFLGLFSLGLSACIPETPTAALSETRTLRQDIPQEPDQEFSEAWEGKYEGVMVWTQVGNPKDTRIPVSLVFERLSDSADYERRTWQITYHDTARGEMVKDYILLRSKTNPHEFWIDEQNGIPLMPEVWAEGMLQGMFSLRDGASVIQSRLYRIGQELDFTVSVFRLPQEAKELGDNQYGVKNYKLVDVQRMRFKPKS